MAALTRNDAFEVEMRKRINAQIDKRRDEVATGALDIEGYRSECGKIAGLFGALEICDEVHDDMDRD